MTAHVHRIQSDSADGMWDIAVVRDARTRDRPNPNDFPADILGALAEWAVAGLVGRGYTHDQIADILTGRNPS